MKTKIAALALAAILVPASSYLVTAATGDRKAGLKGDLSAAQLNPRRGDPAELARLIRATETAVHRTPDALQLGLLARLYLERARLQGDIGSYEQAEAAA